jgi:hypothetical protein
MVTDKVYGTGGLSSYGADYRYNGTTSSDPWVVYANASIKSTFDSWYAANTSAALKAEARIPSLGYETTTAGSGNGWSATWDVAAALSTPGVAAGGATSGVVFPLSISEVTRYIYDGTNNTSRIGTDVAGTAQYWWLRSPGSSAGRGSYVNTSGAVNSSRVGDVTFALRPAIWLDTTP